MSGQCPSCGGQLRPTSRFCPVCGVPVRPAAAGPPQATPPPAGFTVAAPRPPMPAGGVSPRVPRGTVVKEESKKPGTVLYKDKRELPVCGWLVVLRGRRQGRDFRIEKDNSVLGRNGSCDYVIEDDTVSSEHCRIRIEDSKFVINDLGSGNGTYLNGERIYHADLQDGDVLKVGESLVLFKEARPRVPIEQADVPIQPGPKPKP